MRLSSFYAIEIEGKNLWNQNGGARISKVNKGPIGPAWREIEQGRGESAKADQERGGERVLRCGSERRQPPDWDTPGAGPAAAKGLS